MIYMNNLFEGCSSLNYLPDISKWDIKRQIHMKNIFNGCSSLNFLPDISKWEINETYYMDYLDSSSSEKREKKENKIYRLYSENSQISDFSSNKMLEDRKSLLSNFSMENNNLSYNEKDWLEKDDITNYSNNIISFLNDNNLNNDQKEFYENFYN